MSYHKTLSFEVPRYEECSWEIDADDGRDERDPPAVTIGCHGTEIQYTPEQAMQIGEAIVAAARSAGARGNPDRAAAGEIEVDRG